jgi:hypothetical protein
VAVGNPRFVFLNLLLFFLRSFQDNHFIPVCLLVFTYNSSSNLIFN